MDSFFRAVAGILVAVLLILTLGKQGKETALLLSILVCSMAGLLVLGFLQPVLAFVKKLQLTAQLDGEMLQTLLKVTGIALISELAALICSDAGSSALGKVLQYLGGAAVLWLSIPMLTGLLELVESLLGGL